MTGEGKNYALEFKAEEVIPSHAWAIDNASLPITKGEGFCT